jgi:hypothetical protein
MPSLFLFSLPTTVDHAELSARLKDHLSAFVHVNLVRIIRDSRGGVCAFVQCNVKFLRDWFLFFSSTYTRVHRTQHPLHN